MDYALTARQCRQAAAALQVLVDQKFLITLWSTLCCIKAFCVLQEMFADADKDSDGLLSYGELTEAMRQASKEYSHLEEYARYLERWDVPI